MQDLHELSGSKVLGDVSQCKAPVVCACFYSLVPSDGSAHGCLQNKGLPAKNFDCSRPREM